MCLVFRPLLFRFLPFVYTVTLYSAMDRKPRCTGYAPSLVSAGRCRVRSGRDGGKALVCGEKKGFQKHSNKRVSSHAARAHTHRLTHDGADPYGHTPHTAHTHAQDTGHRTQHAARSLIHAYARAAAAQHSGSEGAALLTARRDPPRPAARRRGWGWAAAPARRSAACSP